MIIRTGYMRLVGVLLLLGAAIDALVLNSNRVSASVCQSIEQINQPLGINSIPSGCGPVNYSLAIVLACVGAGLIVVAGFFGNRDKDGSAGGMG
jgi:hypothetical protein